MGKQSSNVADSNLSGNQQAIIIFLESPEGIPKAEKAVSDLTATDLNTDQGMSFLYEKLDKVFQSETIDEAYRTYSAFISFKRTDQMNISDYTVEYEHLYQKIDTDEQWKGPVNVLG